MELFHYFFVVCMVTWHTSVILDSAGWGKINDEFQPGPHSQTLSPKVNKQEREGNREEIFFPLT